MNFLNASLAQLRTTWQRYDARQRMTLSVVVLLGLAAVIGVGMWSSQSEFVPLANRLGPTDAAELISRLQSAGIEYQLSFSGSELLVPKQDWNRAKLAAGDLVNPLQSPTDEISSGIFEDPVQAQYRLSRAQEAAIARSIMRVQGVANATVHVSKPESSPFVRDQKPTTASVILELKPGVQFDRQQSAGIVSMVAHAVAGLNPNDITVMDTRGRILSEQQSPLGSDIARQFEYQRHLETELASKAETMLAQLLGPGKAVVRVAAEIDFTQTTRSETTYDPDAKVKASERITTSNSTEAPAAVSSGSTSNVLPSMPDVSSPEPKASTEETIETEYLNTKFENTITEAPGRIQRLTISAAVDIPQTDSADASAAPALTKEQVEGVIKQAVGFSLTRDDAIEVVVGPLAGMDSFDPALVAGPSVWSQYEGLVRNASLGIASLVLLVIALLTLKKMKPVVVAQPSGAGFTPETARRLNSLAQQVEDDPRAIASVLEAWLGEAAAPDARTNAPPLRKVA